MAYGDIHISGPGGWPLCGESGPLNGFSANSNRCRDCDAKDRPGSAWQLAPQPIAYTPRSNNHRAPNSMMRKRPERLLRGV